MPVGELLIEGRSRKEYLISSYICHPSMANDSLSGVLSAAFLAKHLLSVQETLEFSYRVVFVPETIGAIAYAAKNEQQLKEIDVALVMTTCGGPGKFGYKQSWEKSHYINELVEQVFNSHETEYIKYPFDIHGSDERQYASQAFRINTITITKDKYYEYPYYHTSLDDLNFVKAEYIAKTVELYKELLSNLDKNIIYKNTMTHCEVMLSKHDLYPKTGGTINQLSTGMDKSELDIILELLFYADGSLSLFELSKKIQVGIDVLYRIATILKEKYILERVK